MNIQNNITAPRLVSKKTIKKLGKIFQKPIVNEPNWKDNVLLFYNNNIKPNLFALIIFFVIFLYLTIKYIQKQQKDEKEKKKNIINHILKSKYYPTQINNFANQKTNQFPLPKQQYQQYQQQHKLQKSPNFQQVKNLKKKKKNRKTKNKKQKVDDDIYYRASDNEMNFDSDEIEEIEYTDNDNSSYYSLSKNYEKMIEDNDGTVPIGLLQDVYEQKKSKMTFDELAKLVSGN